MITTVLLDLDDTLLGNPTQQFIERYFAALSSYLSESVSRPMVPGAGDHGAPGDPSMTNSEALRGVLRPDGAREEFESTGARITGPFPALREVTTRRPTARRRSMR
jgi:hypothetical protein